VGLRPICVPLLRRNVGWRDVPAFLALCRIIARERPDIVHTHAAKAGTLGRLASSVVPGRTRRVLVHTYHGHSLSGYFSAPAARVFLAIERFLARRTERLVAVSEQVRDDLVRLGVAPPEQFEIIRCGFDFSRFLVTASDRSARREETRASLRIPTYASVVTLIARLVPIKRVDRFLRVATLVRGHDKTYFLVVGDGELRASLQASAEAQVLGDRLVWTGFRRDIADVCFASDVVALTSDNEGTPISLIESLAAGTPVVSTDVGGVSAVVVNGRSGLLAAPDSEAPLADAITRLLDDDALARRLAAEGQRHVQRLFGMERMLDDLESLYGRLLGTPRPAAGPQSAPARE